MIYATPAAALAEILREVQLLRADAAANRDELQALRADVAAAIAGRPRADPRVGAFLQAIDAVWGNGAWRAGELIAWASDPAFAGRRVVLDAAAALTGAPATAHRLGLRLVRIAGTAADGLMLERVAAREHGARLWAVLSCRVDLPEPTFADGIDRRRDG